MPHLGFIAHISVLGHVDGDPGKVHRIVNTFTYRLVGAGPLPPNRVLLGAFFAGNVWFQIASMLPFDYIGDEIYVTYPQIPNDTPVFAGVPRSGIAGIFRLPVECCVFASLLTGVRGKSFIGKKFISPIFPPAAGKDEYDPAQLLDWQASLNPIGNTLVVPNGVGFDTWIPVVWSRQLSALDMTIPPAIGADITSVRVDATICQRRHRRVQETLPVFHGAFLKIPAAGVTPNAVLSNPVISGVTVYDTDGYLAGGQFTIPPGLGGRYLVCVNMDWNPVVPTNLLLLFFKNGAGGQVASSQDALGTAPFYPLNLAGVDHYNAGDVIQPLAIVTGAGGGTPFDAGSASVSFLGP